MAKERPVDLSVGDALPLGSRIRLRRQAQGVRLATMARDLNYDRGHLSKVENNESVPSDHLVGKIAEYLRSSVDDLTHGPVIALIRKDGDPEEDDQLGTMGFPTLRIRLKPKERTLGQRVERVLAMAHLTPEEEEILAERLVKITGELVAVLKAAAMLR